MEELNKMLEFISGSGYGDGSGYGSGSGSGDCDCDGNGYGNGSGDCDCDGNGYGYWDGSGDGYGDGDGYGYWDGSGDGYGDGDGNTEIKRYKNYLVFYVDNIPTIFNKIKGNVAHCQIINEDDFSIKKCYLVKGNGCFAHGKNLEEARRSLRGKIFAKLNTKEKIQEFIKIFNKTDAYSANDFFDWHSILTGSCLMGRKHFIETHNIDMKRKYTVKEFISICENDYGGEIIKQLKTYY